VLKIFEIFPHPSLAPGPWPGRPTGERGRERGREL